LIKGFLNLLFALLSITIVVYGLGFCFTLSLLGPKIDHFADNLSIPDNIEIAEPMNRNDEIPSGVEDGFQKNLIAELKNPDSGIPSVTAQVPSLIQLHKNAPDILKRYLASSLSWRVFKKYGDLYATRRMKEGSQWRCTLNGFYTHDDDSDIPDFQIRFAIGFSGERWGENTTRLKEGQTDNLIVTQEDILSQYYQMYESNSVISGDGICVELFDQSKAKERKLTKTALDYLEKELSPLANSPSWKTIQTILPSGSIRHGEPSFKLYNSSPDISSRGIYDSEIWVNPHEPGRIYLKAYEVTQNHCLSVKELQQNSNEWIGWSDNPDELFFSNTIFFIDEGDWGEPYAARFEVWFVPDSLTPERKLMEKVFKIEGWQR